MGSPHLTHVRPGYLWPSGNSSNADVGVSAEEKESREMLQTLTRYARVPSTEASSSSDNSNSSTGDSSSVPRMVMGSFSQACTVSRSQFQFLVVYLHSPFHDATPEFCRQPPSPPSTSLLTLPPL